MQAEQTLDPSDHSTRKIESMSDLVAEMVLGAVDEDESSAAAMADAAALEAARSVSVAPLASTFPPALSAPDVDTDVRAFDGSRRRARVATFMTIGALLLAGSGIAALAAR